MKFRLGSLASDIVISIYVAATLLLRLKYENETAVDPVTSIIIGLSFVVILWVLIKLRFLNPNWFGLFTPKKSKS
ncbi:hypothetical protein NBRC110019_28540 [Neptunitalea chrysea]|uniref:Uncharacterized protein n=1 Tax=Neptunitalea chrysea TaxID=1647581 RepID=A0A9W6EWW0_9FLAO|nr:hypothetical protein [Neptunitalea chrysea]GLB53813.1 hypothetical protein NBRC110019_28540 [Neptunitalea chrysea]